MRDVETAVVGGGPAGSSCAWELSRRGREVLILERQELPKFKLCAGWITPRVLRDLELSPGAYPHGMLRLERIRVHLGSTPACVSFPTEQYSIRRVEFDNWLLGRCGAPILRRQVRLVEETDRGYVLDGDVRCRYLVGAGGTNCPVRRRFFGADEGSLVLTQEIEFEASPRTPVCTLFYPFAGLAGYAWYVPKAGAVNVGFGGAAAQFKRNIKTYWPAFVELLLARGLLDSAPPAPESHPYHVASRKKRIRRGNVFIVGDAAGLATADLGEGIGPAIESGLAAARQICGAGDCALERLPQRTLAGLAGRLMARFVAQAGG